MGLVVKSDSSTTKRSLIRETLHVTLNRACLYGVSY